MQLLHSIILGSGEPLLILHGFFGMGDNWKSLANKFSSDFQVHIIDHRNHGRSFHNDDFSYEIMIEDLLYYISYYKLAKVNILGHSMGGKVGMLFAVEFSEKVNKLIVADIAPRYYPPHHQVILKALNSVDFSKITSRNEVDDVLKGYISEDRIRQFLLKNVYRKTKDSLGFRINLQSLTDNVEEVGEALPSFTQFEGETLFLKGENSGYISHEDEVLIKNHFPNSFIETISKAGHWLHAENPIDFFDKIIMFLKK
ncbi:MAG: alpha/beta fold hydrolase [Bacteroidota bacterium]